MSVNWNWSDKCGEFVLEQTIDAKGTKKDFTISIYNGNCMAVFLHEFVEDGKEKYNFVGFFSDKEHAKNCLGLNKGTDNLYSTEWQTIKKVRLDKRKCRYFKDLVALFAQAFNDIDIEIRSTVKINAE